MAIDELESLVNRELDLVFRTIQSYLANFSISPPFKEVIWKSLSRLSPRPQSFSNSNLTLLFPRLSYQACGGSDHFPPEISAAWYLFYLAADLMDSVQDFDQRVDLANTPYSFSEWLNLASSYFFIANAILTALLDQDYDKRRVASVLKSFQERLLEMCEGQQQDLSTQEFSLSSYLEMLRKKSGAFFSLACYAGARMATDDLGCVKNLANFGSHVGSILQILDDLEDWHRLQAGESPLSRSLNWYKNLPTVYTLEVLPDDQKLAFRRVIDNLAERPEEWQSYVAWVNQTGAALYIMTMLTQEAELARKHLHNNRLQPVAKATLIRILNRLVGEN